MKFLRLRDVENITGIKRTTIYALMSEGEFPKNVKITDNAVGWLETEIDEWIESRVNESRNTDAAWYCQCQSFCPKKCPIICSNY